MNPFQSLPSLLSLLVSLAVALGWASGSMAAEATPCLQDCHQSRVQCVQASRNDYRMCRQTCNESVRTAIADARESCTVDGVDREECRERVRTAARAAGEACRPDCREAHRDARKVCHSEARSCTETCRGPVDEACTEQCSVEFAPCVEDLGICRDSCREERRAGHASCSENATNRSEFRDCLRAVHTQARECNIDCHDSLLCRESIHECLDSCRIDPSDENDENDESLVSEETF